LPPGGHPPAARQQLLQLLEVGPAAEGEVVPEALGGREVLGWPKRREWAHALLWEYSYERLKLAQLLGKLGGFPAEGECVSP
jgi:hypothetical protein